MSIRLIHIAPELPPEVGGVADYTAILSRRLVEVSDGTVKPVLVHAGKEAAGEIDVSFPVTDLSDQCSAAALADTIERLADEAEGPAVVLLEYSGYGYAKRGAPWWLVRGLGRACGPDGLSLITMFHELYATGPPWTSAFWMSFVQAYVARRLARFSEGMMTNRASSQEWLVGASRTGSFVELQPVFSNVGEPEYRPPLPPRRNQAVVFGGEGLKELLYRERNGLLQRALHAFGIKRIVDIGPSLAEEVGSGFELPVVRKGVLEAKEVSDHLLESKVGIAHSPSDCITKSGVIAAYFAHGVVPLIFGDVETSKVSAGKHYLDVDRSGIRNVYSLEEMSKTGVQWYREGARSEKSAQKILEMINGVKNIEAHS